MFFVKRILALFRFCYEVAAKPERAQEFVNGLSIPLALWFLSGVVFFWPAGFFLGSYSLYHGLVILIPISILGVMVMAGFWAYTWVLFFALSKFFGGVEAKGLFKLIGVCFSILFLGGLFNVLIALVMFRAPLLPNFIVVLLSLGYFVYAIVKNLQDGLEDGAYIVGLLYVLISFILWFAVKL